MGEKLPLFFDFYKIFWYNKYRKSERRKEMGRISTEKIEEIIEILNERAGYLLERDSENE